MKRIDATIVAHRRPPNLQEDLKGYAFGPFRLDAQRTLLFLHGEPLPLGPRAVATLLALVERSGEVVTKDEILDRVWGNEPVGESNVSQSVYTVRKILRKHGYSTAIVTVPRRGYRFVASLDAQVRSSSEPPIAAATAAPLPAGSARRWLSAATVAMALIGLGFFPAARTGTAPPPLSARGTELYRLGRYYWNLRTPDALVKSAQLFGAVVASDPRNPLGYAGQADADLMITSYGPYDVNVQARYTRALREADAALALDTRSAAAHTSHAMVLNAVAHDGRGALAEFRCAIALDPTYAVAHHWYGITLLRLGRLAEASRELHRAMELDPVSAATSAWLANASYFNHRYADAITYSRLALDLDPRRAGALERLGLAYELAGDLPHAIGAFKRMRAGPYWDHAPALLAEAYARSGRRAAARAALRVAVRLRPHDDDTAFALLSVGERTRGLAILGHMPPGELDVPVTDPRLEGYRAREAAHENDSRVPVV